MTHRMTSAEALANPAIREALRRGEAKVVLDGASEATVVQEIMAALEVLGYRQPGKHKWGDSPRGFYARCGQRNAKKGGSDSGLPDIFLYRFQHPMWPCAGTWPDGWVGFEVKARTKVAAVRPAQKVLEAFGCVHIVNCVADVLKVLGEG